LHGQVQGLVAVHQVDGGAVGHLESGRAVPFPGLEASIDVGRRTLWGNDRDRGGLDNRGSGRRISDAR
jgi:hypothetical protein